MVLMESKNKLKLGDEALEFDLVGIDGKNYSLKDFDGKPFLIIFMCNHCPYVKVKIEHIKKLAEDYKDRITVIGINSNDPDYDEEDSFENMKSYAAEGNYNFVYLVDESQDIAKKYGASCTPDPFLFDKNKRLVYHGRINNQMEPSDDITSEDMKKAFDYVLEGKNIDFEVFPSIGCSIKWKG